MKRSILVAFLAVASLGLGEAQAQPEPEPPAAEAPAALETIAVDGFDGGALTGGAVTDEGLAAMLVDILVLSERYAVLEKGVGSAKPKLLLRGSIVRFDGGAANSGLSVGGAIGGNARRRVSRVAISLRLIEAASGRILAVARAEGEATDEEAAAGLTTGRRGSGATSVGAAAGSTGSMGLALEKAMRRAARELGLI